jgi:anti-sigma factor RsiW
MKRLFNRCMRYRESICLLASDGLPEPERVAVKGHLATCAGCQRYYDELKLVAAPLASWERGLAHIQPDQALQLRWAKAVQAAAESKPVRQLTSKTAFRTLWRELVWPCRRIWAGLAATWLVLIVFNLTHTERSQVVVAKSTTPPEEMRLALQEQRRVLEEIIGVTSPAPAAEPPRRPNTQPRSERRSIAMA